MPVCPKCHKLISESHYERHLGRCGMSHKHPPPLQQSIYLPPTTSQDLANNQGGLIPWPVTSQFTVKKRGWVRILIWAMILVMIGVGSITLFLLLHP